MAGDPARKWWALIAIAASVLVVGLDLTVLNLALPTIATDLHASTSDLQWISSAYSLVLAAGVVPAGMLGDRLGRKKVLLAALVLFGASSVVCAYATGTGELIAGRGGAGRGGASAGVPARHGRGRADRGAGGARDRCRRYLPAVALGDPGTVRPRGAA